MPGNNEIVYEIWANNKLIYDYKQPCNFLLDIDNNQFRDIKVLMSYSLIRADIRFNKEGTWYNVTTDFQNCEGYMPNNLFTIGAVQISAASEDFITINDHNFQRLDIPDARIWKIVFTGITILLAFLVVVIEHGSYFRFLQYILLTVPLYLSVTFPYYGILIVGVTVIILIIISVIPISNHNTTNKVGIYYVIEVTDVVLLIFYLMLMAIFDFVIIETFKLVPYQHILNTTPYWEIFFHTFTPFIFWGMAFIELVISRFRRIGEYMRIYLTGLLFVYSGLEDILYYKLSGTPLPQNFPWFSNVFVNNPTLRDMYRMIFIAILLIFLLHLFPIKRLGAFRKQSVS